MAYGEFGGAQFAAYYKLSDGTDSSGKGINLSNLNTTTFVPGRLGNAGNFVDGTSQALYADGKIPINLSAAFTISTWVYPALLPAAGEYRTVIQLKDNTINKTCQLQLAFDSNPYSTFYFQMFARPTPGAGKIMNFGFANTIGIGRWIHWVATYDGLYGYQYINGHLMRSSNSDGQYVNVDGTSGVNSKRIIIGGLDNAANDSYAPSGYFWPGKIDEVILEQRLWSAKDVYNYYSTTVGARRPYIS